MTVYDAICKVIAGSVEKFVNEHLTRDVAMRIYVEVFNKIREVFDESKLTITEDCMNWIAQSFYNAMKVNGRDELPGDIFTKKVNIRDLNAADLMMLIVIFRGSNTTIEYEVYQEHVRRTGASALCI